MITYQDLLEIGESDKERMGFVRQAINKHRSSAEYGTAKIADEYARHQNTTITQYRKLLYTVSGQAVPDNWSANYKIASNFFHRLITQQNQFLLGNGASWENEQTEARIGEDFDTKLQEAGKKSLVCGVSFGFYNLDHLEVFSLLEFVPLFDEENGALMAGIRFWQIDSTKPLRATLYEVDGYTDYLWNVKTDSDGTILHNKRPYKINVRYSEVDGEEIYDGENYPTFPIVPLWANQNKQSELIGIREQIDAYDLIKSGFANDLDDVSQIYWTVSNAGGMDDIDLAQFVQRMKTVKAAAVDDGQQVETHTVSIPYDARETLLDRIRRDLYRDFMGLDTESIANGAVTATQIMAAYEPLNSKADEYEYCILDFIEGICKIAGIDDTPTFTRSYIVNKTEEATNLIQAAEYFDKEYVTEKLLNLYGDGDKAEDMLQKMAENEIDRGFLNREEPKPEENEGEE